VLPWLSGWSEPVVRGAENKIQNSEVDDGLNSWLQYGAAGGYVLSVVQDAGLSGDNALMIDVTNAAGVTAIGTRQSGLRIEPGVTYPIGFTAMAEHDRQMVVLLQAQVGSTWPTYLTQTVKLTTQPEKFVFQYTHGGSTIGDEPGETLTLYLMLKGTWWTIEGSDLNKRVWIDRVYFGAAPRPGDEAEPGQWRAGRVAGRGPELDAGRVRGHARRVLRDVLCRCRCSQPDQSAERAGRPEPNRELVRPPGRLEFGRTYSEAQRAWSTPQDWTGNGGDTLQLFFHGWRREDVYRRRRSSQTSAGRRRQALHR